MSSYQDNKTVIISLYLQATWSKNDISLVHEISFIYLKFFYHLDWEKVAPWYGRSKFPTAWNVLNFNYKMLEFVRIGTIEDVYMAL